LIFPEEFLHVEAVEAKKKNKPVPKHKFRLDYELNRAAESTHEDYKEERADNEESLFDCYN